jgi:hypothetical protein
MRFTKKTVDIIERDLQTTLTAEEVERGYVVRDVAGFGNVKRVTVFRSKYGALNITAFFDGEPYKFVNAWYERPDARFAKRMQML